MSASLERLLECPVCLEVYTAPRVLGCGHTICTECIEQCTDFSHGRIECPSCRHCQQLPDGGVAALARNYATADIVSLYHQGTLPESEGTERRDGSSHSAAAADPSCPPPSSRVASFDTLAVGDRAIGALSEDTTDVPREPSQACRAPAAPLDDIEHREPLTHREPPAEPPVGPPVKPRATFGVFDLMAPQIEVERKPQVLSDPQVSWHQRQLRDAIAVNNSAWRERRDHERRDHERRDHERRDHERRDRGDEPRGVIEVEDSHCCNGQSVACCGPRSDSDRACFPVTPAEIGSWIERTGRVAGERIRELWSSGSDVD